MAKISVIIPTPCDRKNTLMLNKCINSLIKYKSPNHEYDMWIVANNYTGFSNNVNYGIKRSKSDYVFILNDDTEILGYGWEDIMLKKLNESPDIGIVGHVQSAQHGKYSALWCTMIKREIFDKIGLLDEDMNIYSQDIAFGYLALKQGIRTEFVELPIQHLGSQTTNRLPQQEELKRQAKKVFFEKHGVNHDDI